MKFAELEGTEKQIKWADDIRKKLLKDLEDRKDNMRPKFYVNKMERLEKMLEEETDARFYIEDANGREW